MDVTAPSNPAGRKFTAVDVCRGCLVSWSHFIGAEILGATEETQSSKLIFIFSPSHLTSRLNVRVKSPIFFKGDVIYACKEWQQGLLLLLERLSLSTEVAKQILRTQSYSRFKSRAADMFSSGSQINLVPRIILYRVLQILLSSCFDESFNIVLFLR